jgi:hypothetical protein
VRHLVWIVPLTALIFGAPAGGQSRTDPANGMAGPAWTSGKKDKPRDPNSRNVEGMLTLPDDKPAGGGIVKLKNLKTLQIRSYITQRDGLYHFYSLSTNVDYELTGEFKNMASPTRTLSVFDKRLDAIVNLKLDPGKKSSAEKADEAAAKAQEAK